MKKLLIALCAVVMFFSIGWTQQNLISESGLIVSAQAAKISLNQTSVRMVKGTKIKLKLSGTSATPTWSTSDKTIAVVNSNGKVAAKSKGVAVITATVGKKQYKCRVVVEEPVLNITEITLVSGRTLNLKLSGTKQTVKWSSSNTAVATVTSTGVVSTIASGTVNITATVGKVNFVCVMTVETPKLSQTSLTLEEGNAFKLKVTGTTLPIVWGSSDKTVAKVKNGKVVAISEGTADIVAKVGGKRLTCKVTVKEPVIPLSDIEAVYYELDDGIVALLTNRNKNCIDVDITVLFYDERGALIAAHDSEENDCFPIGSNWTVAYYISGPRNRSFDKIEYADYKVVLTAKKSAWDNKELGNQEISIDSVNTGEEVISTFKNTSDKYFYNVYVTILFYDENDQLIECEGRYVDCNAPGSVDYVTFFYPEYYDDEEEDWVPIIPASYQVIIDAAYD